MKSDRTHITERNKRRRQERHERAVKAARMKDMRVPRGTARGNRRYDLEAFRNERKKRREAERGSRR